LRVGATVMPPEPTNEDVCERCEGEGYLESWNDDQSDVVITLCPDCGPAPGEFDA